MESLEVVRQNLATIEQLSNSKSDKMPEYVFALSVLDIYSFSNLILGKPDKYLIFQEILTFSDLEIKNQHFIFIKKQSFENDAFIL